MPISKQTTQPPSGGCELKREASRRFNSMNTQPPSGGCELKLFIMELIQNIQIQPPSGGCELKRDTIAGKGDGKASRLRAAVS